MEPHARHKIHGISGYCSIQRRTLFLSTPTVINSYILTIVTYINIYFSIAKKKYGYSTIYQNRLLRQSCQQADSQLPLLHSNSHIRLNEHQCLHFWIIRDEITNW